jgi:protein involved in polysaccharide export with SLBB domain
MRLLLIVSLMLWVSACERALVKPSVNLTESAEIATQKTVEVEAVMPTEEIIRTQNSVKFEPRVKVVAPDTGRLAVIPLKAYTRESRPASDGTWSYRVGKGDVLTISRPMWALVNGAGGDGADIFEETVRVSADGKMALVDGIEVVATGKTPMEIKSLLAAQIKSRIVQKADIREIEFPIVAPANHTFGNGDVFAISRLVNVTDPTSGAMAVKPQVTEAIIDQEGRLQLVELPEGIEVAGLDLQGLKSVLQREFLRAGLSTEFTIIPTELRSQTVMVTGDFGSRVVPITPDLKMLDRMLGNLLSGMTESKSGLGSLPDDYLIILQRGQEEYQMLASTLFIEKARDIYELRDGDKVILRKIHEASPVKVAVEAYNSQSISLLTSDALSLVADEQEVKQGKAKALKIPIDENGLTVRNVISKFGVWPEAGEDILINLNRGREKYRFSVKSLMLGSQSSSYYLQNGDILEAEYVRSDMDKYYVVGETGKPMSANLSLRKRDFLTDAIFESELFNNPSADVRHVYLIRSDKNETFKAFKFDFTDITNLKLAAGMEMRPDDIVLVKTIPVYDYNTLTGLILGVFSNTATLAGANN